MRFAAELSLPVQLHTGHMAGSYNRVDKANAALLAQVLQLHQGLRFDLFHGNWPYMGDLLFLAKNYPNVALNLCWLYMIDPLYAQEMLKRAIMSVPQHKIHGFGGDYEDMPEYAAAHLRLAREVICAALADLVESGWLKEEQALESARAFLFDNPDQFFGLGLAD
jgi:predicted TIM-barrel fold metal-dependent hydrolase